MCLDGVRNAISYEATTKHLETVQMSMNFLGLETWDGKFPL